MDRNPGRCPGLSCGCPFGASERKNAQPQNWRFRLVGGDRFEPLMGHISETRPRWRFGLVGGDRFEPLTGRISETRLRWRFGLVGTRPSRCDEGERG
jgi:hypothetical protein